MSPKPSQLPAQGREINGYSHSTFCVCGLIHGGRGQQIYTWCCIFVVRVTSRDKERSCRMDSAIAPDRRAAAVDHVGS